MDKEERHPLNLYKIKYIIITLRKDMGYVDQGRDGRNPRMEKE
jgi:hypothetical protein